MRRSILRGLGAVTLVVLLAGQALAADKDVARQLLQSGLKAMKAGEFIAAAADLEKSVALLPGPDNLLNLASCYKSLQRYGETLDLLKRLRQEFGGSLKPNLKSASDQLEAEVQALVATLVLSVEPPNAEVTIDGRVSLASSATESYLLAPGDHSIEASLVGYRPLTRSVHLAPGTQTSERLVLEPVPGTLIIINDPAGATVSIDGLDRATTPTDPALELAPGPHRIALRMEGRVPTDQTVEIRSGEQQNLELSLLPIAPPPPPPPLAPLNEPIAEVLTAPVAAPVDSPKPRSRFWKILAPVSAAGALGMGVTAIVLWKVVADDHFNRMKEYDREYLSTGNLNAERNRHVGLENAQKNGYAAIGFGIGAGLLAVTAITAFIVDAREEATNKSSSLSVSATGLRLGF